MKQILKHDPQLAAALKAFIEVQKRELSGSSNWGADLMSRLAAFTKGGKRLRGNLVCFTYEMFSGQQPSEPVIKVGVALELAHAALLIHDDIMDRDAMRRGQASVYYQYQLLAENRHLADPVLFGANMATCVGDATLFLAFQLFSEAEAQLTANYHLGPTFCRYLTEVCLGQMQDIYDDSSPVVPSKSNLLRLMSSKTASYTTTLPLILGGLLAGQKQATLQNLEVIGRRLGLIYQIRDDELGLIGSPAATGKPIGSDIREGKKTLLYYYLVKRCTSADRHRLQSIFGNFELTEADIDFVQSLYGQYKIGALLDADIKKLEQQAVRHVQQLTISDGARSELESLVEFCAVRRA